MALRSCAEGALQANGEAELIVSNFHKQVAFTVPDGSLRAFTLNADLTDWTQRAIFEPEDAIKWPNATRVADLNADGRQDVIVGTGFLTCQLVPWTRALPVASSGLSRLPTGGFGMTSSHPGTG